MKQISEKKCTSCKDIRDRSEFHANRRSSDGLKSLCKSCCRDYVVNNKDKIRPALRAYRQTGKCKQSRSVSKAKYRAKYPQKDKAHSAISRGILAGKIIRQPCQKCGSNENIQAHHEDYDKPLDVMWLCIKHHSDIHAGRF
ncbi:hypothetical protein KAR91_53490 [Candidatus Pacearchaeota archaeon]|nr:hypothetical protein [Candidatus Pacearchaeota archaeon]